MLRFLLILALVYLVTVGLMALSRRRKSIDFSRVREEDLEFPAGFVFGAATSSHQVEGGTTNNNWARWEAQTRDDGLPTIRRGERVGRAADHWNRFPDDLQLMTHLNLDVYRFSLEWSRIEPEPGRFDEEAMARYRSWCEMLLREGINPMVTLHHFTEPLWLTDLGGFENADSISAFARYTEFIVDRLADVVDDWITINEPGVYAVQGWHFAEFPPGKKDPELMLTVLEHLMLAHARAYRIIHSRDRSDADGDGVPCRVSFANNIVMFEPKRWWHLIDQISATLLHRAFNSSLWDAVETGRFSIALPGQASVNSYHSELAGTWDFAALNHYFRQIVYFDPSMPLRTGFAFDESQGVNDMGWGLTPQSLYDALKFTAKYRKPIVITENGICDGEVPDERRQWYLLHCLHAVQKALDDGIDVRGYLYWSLMDNFEWAMGYDPRFGLYRVDYDTQERTLTGGGELYRRITERHRSSRRRMSVSV